MDEKTLAGLITNQQVTIRNQDAFFTNLDRTTQVNDEYSLKAEVFQGMNKIAVIHAHLERLGPDDVITKAHVKSDHNGVKLFDLNSTSLYAGIILGSAFGSGYKVALY